MRRSELWQAAFITLAAFGGYLAAEQHWPWVYLLAFPISFLSVTYSAARPTAVPAAPEQEETAEALQRRLEDVQLAADAATARAAAASAGLVKAAELAVRTEEDVRAMIVADLHDSPAQTLVALNYLRVDPDVTFDQVVALAAEAEIQLRDVMAAQRPLAANLTSLAQMLAHHLHEVERRWGLKVEVSWPTGFDGALSYPVTVVLYRFAAEALMNVVKHAGVDTATLRLDIDARNIVLVVQDGGTGFDPALLERTDRLGLNLVRHRAEMVGGLATFSSAPGEGTIAELQIPITERPLTAPPGLVTGT